MTAISCGMPSKGRMPDAWFRKAQNRAAKTMPTGWLRPSSAMAMPMKPMPVGKSRA